MEHLKIVYMDKEDNFIITGIAPNTKMPFDEIIANVVPKNTQYYIMPESDLPDSFDFVDAWEYKNGEVNVNMSKARDIHMSRIRMYRDDKLITLDAEQNKRVSMDQDWSDIRTEKQRLRDIPQTFDLSKYTDIPSLRKAIPDGINMPAPTEA